MHFNFIWTLASICTFIFNVLCVPTLSPTLVQPGSLHPSGSSKPGPRCWQGRASAYNPNFLGSPRQGARSSHKSFARHYSNTVSATESPLLLARMNAEPQLALPTGYSSSSSDDVSSQQSLSELEREHPGYEGSSNDEAARQEAEADRAWWSAFPESEVPSM